MSVFKNIILIMIIAFSTPAIASLDEEAANAVETVVYEAAATLAAYKRQSNERFRKDRNQIEELAFQVASAKGTNKHQIEATRRLQRQLREAQSRFVAELAAKDRTYKTVIAGFRKDVEDIARTPEGVEALALYNAGEEVRALTLLDALEDLAFKAEENATQIRLNIRRAVRKRKNASLALEARQKGKFSTSDLIKRFEEITRLDPDVSSDLFQLTHLYMASGHLDLALDAAMRGELSAKEDYDRMAALKLMGDIKHFQGDQNAQLLDYRKALEIAKAHTAREPDSVEWRYLLSNSLKEMGDKLFSSGDDVSGLLNYQKSVEILETLAAREPDNMVWQYYLSQGHRRIGNLKLNLVLMRVMVDPEGLTAALQSFQRAFEIAKTLVAREPDKVEWQNNLSISHARIGEVHLHRLDWAAALLSYQNSIKIAKTLVTLEPDNGEWKVMLSAMHNEIGDLHYVRKDRASGLLSYKKSLEIDIALGAVDPGNFAHQHSIAVSHSKIADVQSMEGNWAVGLASYQKALHVLEELVARDASNVLWQRDLSTIHRRMGEAQLSLGNLSASLLSTQKWHEILKTLIVSDTFTWDQQISLSISYMEIGDVQQLQGKWAAGLVNYKKALHLVKALVPSDLNRGRIELLINRLNKKIQTCHDYGVEGADCVTTP